MEIINYTEEHRIFRDAVRKFFEKEVTPFVEEWEEAGIVPKSVWKKMGEQGFLCTDVPEEYGGVGADFLYSVILTEELGKTGCTGIAAPLHSDVVVPYITAYASEELKRKYLPGCVSGDIITAVAMTEPNAGSDLAAIRTTAVEDGDHIVINGERAPRVPNTSSMIVRRVEGEAVTLNLSMLGFAVSSGSACATGASEPSYVLEAMGLNPADAQGGLRVSLGIMNTDEDVDGFLDVFPRIVHRLRDLSPLKEC